MLFVGTLLYGYKQTIQRNYQPGLNTFRSQGGQGRFVDLSDFNKT